LPDAFCSVRMAFDSQAGTKDVIAVSGSAGTRKLGNTLVRRIEAWGSD
jgi:hypothetical protein